MNKNNLTSKLKELQGNNDLKDYVIKYILRNYKTDDDIKCFFSDLTMGGCQSGMIHTLIHYEDTRKFYDKYYNEIEELREEWKFQTGEDLKPDGDLKNWFAWFAFEETARNLAIEIGLDF